MFTINLAFAYSHACFVHFYACISLYSIAHYTRILHLLVALFIRVISSPPHVLSLVRVCHTYLSTYGTFCMFPFSVPAFFAVCICRFWCFRRVPFIPSVPFSLLCFAELYFSRCVIWYFFFADACFAF